MPNENYCTCTMFTVGSCNVCQAERIGRETAQEALQEVREMLSARAKEPQEPQEYIFKGKQIYVRGDLYSQVFDTLGDLARDNKQQREQLARQTRELSRLRRVERRAHSRWEREQEQKKSDLETLGMLYRRLGNEGYIMIEVNGQHVPILDQLGEIVERLHREVYRDGDEL